MRGVVILATVVLAVALAAIWLVAVPMGVPCPAIYPPPPGCTVADRASTGALWTILVAGVYAGSIALALTAGRRRWWLTAAAMVILVAVAIVGFGAVQGSTGYVIPW
ncbi:hypothetical protein IM660_00450 [Ruania alkalisoli]|uniref:Uncharacterized protein n=1 Tax=Ruania alkalisoli TaxID=2779775 RepID=A0A7M1STD0_9MICO|nr:hypothetical protein [Ruania alkalisoli]QOR70828.1 hypothetical protein IM660_00450 [Ruania alkalisoli]